MRGEREEEEEEEEDDDEADNPTNRKGGERGWKIERCGARSWDQTGRRKEDVSCVVEQRKLDAELKGAERPGGATPGRRKSPSLAGGGGYGTGPKHNASTWEQGGLDDYIENPDKDPKSKSTVRRVWA
ncbi:uncharacterized protein CIMG_07512 [Coccidioides immitis RS]|uniref:Uncharacterized protein n=3 Tax=Coccidioides immitis TaxID=5501 RepID=A0A0E1RUZ0_COCIM|nr:uncharacterized protein CIMG_07512 [Coccidioides immitis RS]EAS28766.1 hypothetical protein CIMG_07512 [Coccidioides immitis RS]KMP05871.1 hypothetical protein CIRG_05552 [Coccidioides immitis RMSCC 2394]KMU91445.1 hypothetical protein CIHG_09314 [Coccidioides immitis H538.4]